MPVYTPNHGPYKVFGTVGDLDIDRPGLEAANRSLIIFGSDTNNQGVRGGSREQAFANANFIARACNMHEPLMDVVDAFSWFLTLHEGDICTNQRKRDAFNEVMAKITTARSVLDNCVREESVVLGLTP